MRERTSLPISRAPISSPTSHRPVAPFTADEKRQIFKGMVVAELDAGFLRYSRRQALLNYAAKLGIAEFEATLLIAEAQYGSDEIEPVEFDSAATFETLTRPERWSVALRLAFVLVAAVFIDLLLIWYLFR